MCFRCGDDLELTVIEALLASLSVRLHNVVGVGAGTVCREGSVSSSCLDQSSCLSAHIIGNRDEAGDGGVYLFLFEGF